jgi:hypothetical protein
MSEREYQAPFVYRLFVNDERTLLVRVWDEGAEVATRESPAHTWGPPTYLTEEKTR